VAKKAVGSLHAAKKTAGEPGAKAPTKNPAARRTRKKNAGVQDAYDAIAKSWDDNRKRPFSPLPLFVEEFQKRFSKRAGTLLHAKILDAGCGNARNAIWLSKKFPNACIYCCDISAGMLHSASRNVIAACKAHSCVISKADIENTRYPSSLFDAVLCTAVLHHLPSREGRVRALTEIRRVLKPGGFAFLSVWGDPKARPGSDRQVEFPARQGKNIPRFYHFFTKRELEDTAFAAGLSVASIFYESKGRRLEKKGASRACNTCVILERNNRARPVGKLG